MNPKYKDQELAGYKFYESISSIPDDSPIDLAMVAVPAKITPIILEELGKKGVSFVHIFSSGFSELDSEFDKTGKKLEEELIKIASKYGIRILGPNCMGIHNPKGKMTFLMAPFMEEGSVGFISQSGGIAVAHGMRSPSLGYYFSKNISLGNQIDLDLIDFLRYFKDDPDTKIIGLYVENLKRDGNKLIPLLKEITPTKPVILWKGGKLQTGHQAVMSHTGGMAGEYKLWQTMAHQTGTILVDDLKELTEMVQTCLTYPIPKTLGTAVLSMSGGTAVDSTDKVELNGLIMPRISENTYKKINEFIPEVNSNLKNPLEYGGNNSMKATLKTIELLAEEKQFSFIILGASPEFIVYRRGNSLDDYLKDLSNALPPDSDKLLMCVTSSMTMSSAGIKLNSQFRSRSLSHGFVAYDSTEAAAKCCYRLWEYGQYLERRNLIKRNNKKVVVSK
ncbi:MAG: CoA-binding protein [Candidatus Lokiarchaeota archaeon]|nr:CoA-binding protein [Candidatus Lokiarchaeota archaeon]